MHAGTKQTRGWKKRERERQTNSIMQVSVEQLPRHSTFKAFAFFTANRIHTKFLRGSRIARIPNERTIRVPLALHQNPYTPYSVSEVIWLPLVFVPLGETESGRNDGSEETTRTKQVGKSHRARIRPWAAYVQYMHSQLASKARPELNRKAKYGASNVELVGLNAYIFVSIVKLSHSLMCYEFIDGR